MRSGFCRYCLGAVPAMAITSLLPVAEADQVVTFLYQGSQRSEFGMMTVKRVRSENVVESRQSLKLGLQVRRHRSHFACEPSSPIGFVKSIKANSQRMFDIVDVGEDILGHLNTIAFQGVI